ncbi:hypothetical protein RR48_11914 [Papilio machaon]|uniref:Uncharacterized protein n=1 Tax=Papilio machaon TaxID=76193 RepID=A0A194RPW8_PAPMA|nr:hypothetical protein RR48_11914 [Papilio machaon]
MLHIFEKKFIYMCEVNPHWVSMVDYVLVTTNLGAGVLGLMLHSTYNHEVMERITKVNENGKMKESS